MTILYSDPRRLPLEDEQRLGARHVSLDELLAEADIVTIHAIYTKETFHLIGAPEIARMKPTTSLINISRGPVLDEAALVAALKEGRLAGAALDVHEDEPRVNPELVKMDNVVLTPHLGSAVAELREEMALFVADNILAAIDGRRPQNVANPAVYA
jgi:glyoxylate reductase